MLHLHYSNRLERLLDQLAEVTAEPLPDPLAPEWVLVHSEGMARWLALGLAERSGIAANLRFFMPGAFVWRLLSALMPEAGEASTYDREVLAWRLMALLPELLGQPGFEPLRRYLTDDRRELKQWQLAGRIAELFDRYSVYRPAMVLGWEAGEGGDEWQAQLWRALVARAEGPHRAELLRRFFERGEVGELALDRLPRRLTAFALTALPPVYVEVLHRLAQSIDIHLFLLNPSLLYWGDLRDERNLARLRRQHARLGRPVEEEYYSVGNPLLASLGRQGREFLDLLQEFPAMEHELFEEPAGESLLAWLQRDLLLLEDRGADEAIDLPRGDHSLQLHSCHGPLREVEVLHDRLLALFDQDPTLAPHQVIVMTPDIERYAPYIEAVFEASGEGRRLPWAVADLSRKSRSPVLSALLALLDLPRGRFTATELLSLLEVPALLLRAGLDQGEFEAIRTWVRESHIRWGLDGAARAAAGLPSEEANTWEFGFRRLFLGYAMPPGADLFRGVLPYPHVEGRQAEALGKLRAFVERAAGLSRRLAQPHDATGWVALIGELLDALFDTEDETAQALQPVRDALDQLAEQAARGGFADPFGLDLLRDYLSGALGDSEVNQNFLTGRITFCALMPMRAIPFRVVCLIGMNDRDFPRQQRPLGFDLMAAHPQRGDRSRREEERYLFLEALLSARDNLYISYVGRNARDNAPLLPSVLVSELLDYLEQGYRVEGGSVRHHLLTEHPLQPFSPRYFDGREERLFSYAGEWLPGALAHAAERRPHPPFCPEPLPAEGEEAVVELEELAAFFRHPARAFLSRRLGIRFEEREEVLEEAEPFEVAGLERYLLGRRLLEKALDGAAPAEELPRLRAEGGLPSGPFARLALEECAAGMDGFVAALHPLAASPSAPLELDLKVGAYRLVGWLEGRQVGGLLRYRYATTTAADRLDLWVRHLALSAVSPEEGVRSLHLGRDGLLCLGQVADPLDRLRELLEIFSAGRSRPLPFFPRAAWEFVVAESKGGDGWSAARRAWEPGFGGRSGEGDDEVIRTAFRGVEPLGEEFALLARTIFVPLLAARVGEGE